MLMKLQVVSGAAAVGMLALQGCSSDDSGTQGTALGDACTVGAEGACGAGTESGTDFVCRDFDGDSYCTLPCEDGEVGQCGAGQQGGGAFECNAPQDGSGFCEKTEEPLPSGATTFGATCTPNSMGVCGAGTQSGTDFECKEDPAKSGDYFCTQSCTGAALGECGATSNPPSGFACNKQAGICVPKDEVPEEPTYTWGESCGKMGGCGHGIQGYTPQFDCLTNPATNEDICTNSCTGAEGIVGECGAGTQNSPGFVCYNKVCIPESDVPQEPSVTYGDKCVPGNVGVCGQGTRGGSDFECKSIPGTDAATESFCTTSCTGGRVGECGEGQRTPSSFTCGPNGFCVPE